MTQPFRQDLDYYEILQVHPKASAVVIQKAYRALVTECHPDRGGSEQQIKLLNEAYEVLNDADKRAAYDKHRKATGALFARQPEATVVLRCRKCQRKNRVVMSRVNEARCGFCRTDFSRGTTQLALADRVAMGRDRALAIVANWLRKAGFLRS